ncbi:MAG: hypothetical protein QM723_05270 [Myxococcaceae bacterium]
MRALLVVTVSSLVVGCESPPTCPPVTRDAGYSLTVAGTCGGTYGSHFEADGFHVGTTTNPMRLGVEQDDGGCPWSQNECAVTIDCRQSSDGQVVTGHFQLTERLDGGLAGTMQLNGTACDNSYEVSSAAL